MPSFASINPGFYEQRDHLARALPYKLRRATERQGFDIDMGDWYDRSPVNRLLRDRYWFWIMDTWMDSEIYLPGTLIE